ncbi:MAG TPA: ACT domain-containing protein [Gammaproteobacteria bacterium]
MKNFLVLTALGANTPELTSRLCEEIKLCGCNIVDSRMALLGEEFTMVVMVSGPWDAIAKIEDHVAKLEKDLNLKITTSRTKMNSPGKSFMPYAIDVVASDKSGVVHEIARFISENDVLIQDMYTNTYKAAFSDTTMFSLHMTINVPTDTSIATLRSDFMDFCDRHNLDAIIEPVK